MLPEKCEWCDVPLMEFRGSVTCVVCTEPLLHQQEQLDHVEKQEGVARSDVSTMTNATEDSIEIMLDDKGATMEPKNRKNALFMAAIAGLANEAKRKLLEDDERQETVNPREQEQANQREKTVDEVDFNKDLDVPPPPPHPRSALTYPEINPPTSPLNRSLNREAAHETSSKHILEPITGRLARSGIDVTPLPPLSPPTNDIPEINSSSRQLEHVSPNSAHVARKTNTTPSPQPPRPVIRYPSPNLTTRKMMTINNLTKEPQHQIKAASYRGKAYITPFRERSKNSVSADNCSEDNSSVDDNEEKEKSQEGSPEEQKKTTQSSPNITDDSGFFQELKHRAALQNASHTLLNAEHAVAKQSNKERVDSVALQSCHDEVSALGSQSSFESEVPSKASVATQNSSNKAPLLSTQQTIDILPDDEKKDIAIEVMKEFKAPLPFDEGSAKSAMADKGVDESPILDDYQTVTSTRAVRGTEVAGADPEVTLTEGVEREIVAKKTDGYHSVQNTSRDENETVSSSSTKRENQRQSKDMVDEGSAKTLQSAGVETKQLEAMAAVNSVKIDVVKPAIEMEGRTAAKVEDTGSNLQSSPTANGSNNATIETNTTLKAEESSSDRAKVPEESTPNFEENRSDELRQSSTAAKCYNEVVTKTNSAAKTAESALNHVESHTFTAIKSLRSHKSSLKYSGGANLDEDRSLKSMPATSFQVPIRRDFREELEEFKSRMRLAALMESAGKDEVVEKNPQDVKQSTLEKKETEYNNDKQGEEGACAISIKEIKVCTHRGDASTALASISSKMEHQTRRLAQLEAEALRKHKEAEKAALKAREALEKMLEARSQPKGTNAASRVNNVKSADLSMCSTRGSRPGSLKKIPTTSGNIKVGDKESLSLASRSKYSSKHSRNMSEKLSESTRKQAEMKSHLLDGRDDIADLSMCSTLSEDSGLKFDKAIPATGARARDHNHEKNYASVTSRSGRISVAGSNRSEELSFARGKQDEAQRILSGRNINQTTLSETPSSTSRPKKYPPSLHHSYSDASFSQHSASVAETSCRSSETGSSCELESVSSNGSSTHNSSTEGIRHEVGDVKKKHQNISHQILETKRSSSKGRYRDQSPPSTQRSKSSSPVEVTKKKKDLLLPSLLSPDPPSKPGNRHRAGNDHANRRSHSLPRNKSSRSKSKDSGKMLAKTDFLMSKTNSSKKPNHLLHYSSRHGSKNVSKGTTTHIPSRISPEVRQPVMSRSASTPQKQSDFLVSGKNPDSRQLSFSSHGSAPISLANYTSRESASSARHQFGMSPEIRFLPHDQAQHSRGNSPNTQHHMTSRHAPGPMSRPTYANREDTVYPNDTKFDTFGERTFLTVTPGTQLTGASFHQYLPGQSLTPKGINEHGHFGFKSGSDGPYPMSRNVDSIALASHTTFRERMSQARTHHHPVMTFSQTADMRTPLMMSSGTVRPPYSSGRVEYLGEEGMHYADPQGRTIDTLGIHTPLMASNGTARPLYSSGHEDYLHEEGMHYSQPQEHKVRFVDPYVGGSEMGVDMSHAKQHYSMPYGRHNGY